MSILTQAIYDRLAADTTLTDLLATYEGLPAIFTIDPAPGGATLPYIVTAGEVSQLPFDTKVTRGRDLIRDVRCYAPVDGSTVTIEAIAERVRALLHRQPMTIDGYHWVLSDVSGPIAADEPDAYGRVLSLALKAQETITIYATPDSRVLTTGVEDTGLANADEQDGTYYQISEVVGVPGFDVEIIFDHGHGHAHQVGLYGYYSGNAGHTVNVQAWNYDTGSWDTKGTLPDADEDALHEYDINSTDYASGGITRIRIYHASPGNINHDLLIDYLYLLIVE